MSSSNNGNNAATKRSLKDNKILGIFFFTFIVLAGLLWMPIYLAGPDGLERTMYDLTGNEEYKPDTSVENNVAPFPDYEFPWGTASYFETWLIGIIGGIISMVIAIGLMKLVKSKRDDSNAVEN